MSNNKLRVALCQMDIVWENKAANKVVCEKFVKQSIKNRAELIIFPEMTLTGFSMDVEMNGEDIKNSGTVMFFKGLAQKYSICIIFGLTGKINGKGINLALALDNDGKVSATYQKMHPFSYSKENEYFLAGSELSIFKIKNFTCSLTICYDLRFPGLFEAISRQQPDVVVVVANWPTKRIKHWDTLLAARALDTQSYILGINRVGRGGDINYCGHSSAYDPSGQRLAIANGAQNIYINLNKATVGKKRQEFPFLKDKRYSLYKIL